MRAAIKQVCAANVLLIICRPDNCPAAVSRPKSKKHTTEASRPSQKRGNFNKSIFGLACAKCAEEPAGLLVIGVDLKGLFERFNRLVEFALF